jgi:hypothetical protein
MKTTQSRMVLFKIVSRAPHLAFVMPAPYLSNSTLVYRWSLGHVK